MAAHTETQDEAHYVKTFFRQEDYDRIVKQARREGRTLANWLRFVALDSLGGDTLGGSDRSARVGG
jgi:hypothetical protein